MITTMQGEVIFLKRNSTTWEQAKRGQILKTGDKIKTGRNGRATTVSKEGHRIVIKEKTIFEVSKLTLQELDFYQEIGKVRLRVAPLGSGQTLRVKTPTAICAVRGTEFEVTVLENQSTILDVFKGMVNFGDLRGAAPEIQVLENQRIILEQGASPKAPEMIPAEQMQKEEEPKEEGKTKGTDEDRKQDHARREESRESFKREILKEITLNVQRENRESDTVFEQQSSQYEQGRTLIDAFGQRVRVEDYITRPAPESFKYVSLNTRAGRMDYGFFEVVANKPLPADLKAAGNLWNSIGSIKPEYYAVKERWFASNHRDSITLLSLDGDSKLVQFQQPVFSNTGQLLSAANQTGYQTVYDHRYEFINGNPGAIERIWGDPNFRPLDNGTVSGVAVTGLMWHMKPILIEEYDPAIGVTASFWVDTFINTSGSAGKMTMQSHQSDPNPALAHFIEKMSYINYEDTNNNGRLDLGERFLDRNGNGMRDADEPFHDVVQFGLNGSRNNARNFDAIGDHLFFSDLNRDGLNNDGASGSDPFLIAQKPWAWQSADEYMINDFGEILDFNKSGMTNLAQGQEDQSAISEAFENVNFERVWKSSEFVQEKIDLVFNPRLFMQAGMIQPKSQGNEPVDYRH